MSGSRRAMNILVTGITGYVGSRLALRLQEDGHAIRGFSRRAGSPTAEIPVPTVTGDAVSGSGLAQAMQGIDVAYFLMHSMEPSSNGSFGLREHAAAENFAREAAAAGVQRIVYLGGIIPAR